MNSSLLDIKQNIEEFAEIIGAPLHLLPKVGAYYDSLPYIGIDASGCLFYEISERGKLIKRDYAYDKDHLLYLVFRDITKRLSIQIASTDESRGKDYRRQRLQTQLELLGRLSEKWREWESERQKGIALHYPLDDVDGKRQAYIRELMGNGYLQHEAIAKAAEKFAG